MGRRDREREEEDRREGWRKERGGKPRGKEGGRKGEGRGGGIKERNEGERKGRKWELSRSKKIYKCTTEAIQEAPSNVYPWFLGQMEWEVI